MERTSKALLLSTLTIVTFLLLVTLASGLGDIVVIASSTINNAPTSGTTDLPLREDLVMCPFLVPELGGIFDYNFADFVVVNCTNATGLIPLADCNSAITKTAPYSIRGYPTIPIPLLPYNSSGANPYTAGYYATYVGGLDLGETNGIAFQVNLKAGAAADNAAVIESVVQGARGLVTLSGANTTLTVVIYTVDSTGAANPCADGNDLDGVNFPSLYTLSPNTQAHLILNVSDSGSSRCDAQDAVSMIGHSPNFSNGSRSCTPSRFSSSDPRTYYPANFVSADCVDICVAHRLGDEIGKHTDLNFYPHLSARGILGSDIDLASVIACINSTATTSVSFGSVRALVVECDDFHTVSTILEHLHACQTALDRVRRLVGSSVKLLVSFQLRVIPEPEDYPASIQGLYAVSALYDTSVVGAVIGLGLNATATSEAAVEANFAGVTTIVHAFSSIFSQGGGSGVTFNLILRFNPSYCDAAGPLAPYSTGLRLISVYSSCVMSGMNCLFASDFASVTAGTSTACGFPETSVLSWVPFRGVATGATIGTGPNTTKCDGSTVVPGYSNMTIASTGVLDGASFEFGTIGGSITSGAAGTGAAAACVFSGAGAGASYGIVVCNSSSPNFVEACVSGFGALRGAATDAAIVARFGANASSDDLNSLGLTAGKLLNATGWSGAYIDLMFGDGIDAGTNLQVVTHFVETIVGATTLPSGTELTIGIGVSSSSACLAGGALYSSNVNTTLYTHLTDVVSSGVSFVLLPRDTPSVSVTQLCGFDMTRVGYELQVVRTFAGTCSSVDLSYGLVTLSSTAAPITPSSFPITPLDPSTTFIPATPLDPSTTFIPTTPLYLPGVPLNPSSPRGGGAGESSPSPYWAFFAIPGAAILICFVSTGLVAAIYFYHHRRQDRYLRLISTLNPSTSIELV